MSEDPVVVVGAGLAGMRAVEGLLGEDLPGSVVVLGDEPHLPYNRPALSKEDFRADDVDRLSYRLREDPRVTWRTATRVVAADLTDREVRLTDGVTLGYSGLVIASGVRPRRLLVPGPAAGRFTVRTIDDALALRRALGSASRIAVVGGGVLGCELSSTLRNIGMAVDLILGPDPLPLHGLVGEAVGTELLNRHIDEGTRVHPSTTVCAYTGSNRIDGLLLTSSRHVTADLVIEAIGCDPDVDWLIGHHLDLSGGVPCEPDLSVPGHRDAVACGDAVRLTPTRQEHWTHASETGRHAGRTLARRLQGLPPLPPFLHLPTWWSDQVGTRLHGIGALSPTAEVHVLEGDLRSSAVVGYHAEGQLIGVVLIGQTERLPHYRRLLAAALRNSPTSPHIERSGRPRCNATIALPS